MIVFEKLRYRNFLSSGNEFIELNLNGFKHTLIVGENGAGKSTFLDALTFALFGKPFRNINKPQLVNSVNEKQCVVEVEFSSANRKYKVVRGIKPNLFEIYCNGALVDQDSRAKDYQEQLENLILRMNFKSFSQIVILGSTNFRPFMQLTAADRRAVIEDLLDIQIFSSMNKIVKAKITGFESDATSLKIQIDSLKSRIELHAKHLAEFKKNNQELINTKLEKINFNNNEISKCEAELGTLQAEIATLLESIQHEKKLRDKYYTMNGLSHTIGGKLQKLSNDILFYMDNDVCPSCSQTIPNREEKLHQCEENHEKVSEGKKKITEDLRKLEAELNKITQTHNEIHQKQSLVSATNAKIQTLREDIDSINSEIDKLRNKPPVSDDFTKQSEKMIDELSTLLDERQEALTNLQYYDVVGQLLKDGGVKAQIIKQYIPIINRMMNKYLASMNFFVNFTLDEEFKETIRSRHRDVFSYENFSEGEKKRIDLAILFTWRTVAKMKNSMNTNLLIFDEVFDGSLDVNGTDEFMKLLTTLNDESNVFVISHKTDQLVDKFQNVMRFAKVKNFSQVMT